MKVWVVIYDEPYEGYDAPVAVLTNEANAHALAEALYGLQGEAIEYDLDEMPTMTPRKLAEYKQLRGIQVGDRMRWLWSATRNGHVLPVHVLVVGVTPKRVRVRTFHSRVSDVVEKLVKPDDLRHLTGGPADQAETLQGISDTGHIEHEDWINQHKVTWDDLIAAKVGDLLDPGAAAIRRMKGAEAYTRAHAGRADSEW